DDFGVASRDRRTIEPDADATAAPKQVVTFREPHLTGFPDNPVGTERVDRGFRMRQVLGRDAREGITTAMHGPNEPWIRGGCSNRGRELGDQGRQIYLGYERVGPQPLIQLVFGNHTGAMGDEHVQQIECLRREVDDIGLPHQLPCPDFQRELAELKPECLSHHVSLCRWPRILADQPNPNLLIGFPKDFPCAAIVRFTTNAAHNPSGSLLLWRATCETDS